MNLLQKKAEIIRFKSMVDGSIRVELDFGELSKEEMSELHGLKTEKVIDIILVTSDSIDNIIKKKDDWYKEIK